MNLQGSIDLFNVVIALITEGANLPAEGSPAMQVVKDEAQPADEVQPTQETQS